MNVLGSTYQTVQTGFLNMVDKCTEVKEGDLFLILSGVIWVTMCLLLVALFGILNCFNTIFVKV